jgi:hypothetical protein
VQKEFFHSATIMVIQTRMMDGNAEYDRVFESLWIQT